MTSLLTRFLQTFTYVALVLVLLAAGFGVPIPEDIPLVTAGWLTNPNHSPIGMEDTDGDGKPDRITEAGRKRVPHLYLMIIAGMIGVLGGDTMVFYIGRKGIDTDNFVARHIRKVMHSNRREKAERHFAKHGNLTVFCGRFMPGFRSLVFAMAGMAKMSYTRFLLIDGFAALISVPAFVILGHYFAGNINQVIAWIDKIKHIAGPILLVAAAIGVIVYIVRKRKRAAAAAAESKQLNGAAVSTPSSAAGYAISSSSK